jgi:hypothetical protein
MESVSNVSSTPNTFQISLQGDLATKAAKPLAPPTPTGTTATSGPTDSDGDHDGSSLNVTA